MAVLPALPQFSETAAKIAHELQLKNLYVFIAAENNGVRFSEQLVEAGVQIGWNTRLASFSPDVSGAVFALGFAVRAAMALFLLLCLQWVLYQMNGMQTQPAV